MLFPFSKPPWKHADISFRSHRKKCYASLIWSKNWDIRDTCTQRAAVGNMLSLSLPQKNTRLRFELSDPGTRSWSWSNPPRILICCVVRLCGWIPCAPSYLLLPGSGGKPFKNGCICQVEMSRLRAVCCLSLKRAISGLLLVSVLVPSLSARLLRTW